MAPKLDRRLVGAVLLDKGRTDREYDHNGDDDRRPHIAKEIGDHCQGKQQPVEGIIGATPDFLGDCWPSLTSNEIEPKTP
jgi:hypothetical protein